MRLFDKVKAAIAAVAAMAGINRAGDPILPWQEPSVAAGTIPRRSRNNTAAGQKNVQRAFRNRVAKRRRLKELATESRRRNRRVG